MTTDVSEDIPPEILFHYSTQAGLLGIAEMPVIWATKIQYFNDSAEFHLTLDLAQSLIDDAVGNIPERLSEDGGAALKTEIAAIRNANIFAVSLTEEGDLLSQWRAYGTPGNAFALGFRSNVLSGIAEGLGWQLTRCVYEPSEHREAVGAVVDRAVTNPGEADAGDKLRVELLSLASRMKHFSFEEEREWRLISPLLDELDFRYRPGRSTLVPYVEFPLVNKEGNLALEE